MHNSTTYKSRAPTLQTPYHKILSLDNNCSQANGDQIMEHVKVRLWRITLLVQNATASAKSQWVKGWQASKPPREARGWAFKMPVAP